MDFREYRTAFLVGAASSVLWFFVLKHLSLLTEGELVAGVIILPFLFVLGIAIARHWFSGRMVHKLAKFLMVGVLNTGIDLFIFDTLIVLTGRATGTPIIAFKSLSFVCALFNSYELNRLWTFSGESAPRRTRNEFSRFAAITVVGFLVNVGATYGIVAAFAPPFGVSQIRWDNVAAVVATVLNLAWNFIGYKLFVFNANGGNVTEDTDIASPNII